MRLLQKLYCRGFQAGLRLALPFLPYRSLRILSSVQEVPQCLLEKHITNVLVVTDGFLHISGMLEPLKQALKSQGISYTVYDEVTPNPTILNVELARERYLENGCQGLIGFGGGSSIDCAKAVGARIARPNKPIPKMRGILQVLLPIPYLIAVPTTAGTGSETTLATVITDDKNAHKFPINDFPLIPKVAVLDPEMTRSLPKHMTSTTGMDALTHAIEAYIGQTTTRQTRSDALEAARLVAENLETAYADGDNMTARANMLRAAFLADPLLRRVGLHGKSFIPMIMGFGCNVPAVMATRTIESRKSRLITMMTLPFMSCSARLPVFTVLSGAFFPEHAALVMLCLYAGGILVSFVSAYAMNKVFRRTEESHFVMEMPPYRMPAGRGVLRHTWERARQYLRKMGGIILAASIVIWALGYFPQSDTARTAAEQQEQSCLGRIGHAISPVLEPLGYDWRMGVGILSGVGAKELMVSTIGVLYNCAEDEDGEVSDASLSQAMRESGATPAAGLSYLVFALLYFPCLATIAAIKGESGRWRYAAFTAVYTTAVAYVMAFVVYRLALLWL